MKWRKMAGSIVGTPKKKTKYITKFSHWTNQKKLFQILIPGRESLFNIRFIFLGNSYPFFLILLSFFIALFINFLSLAFFLQFFLLLFLWHSISHRPLSRESIFYYSFAKRTLHKHTIQNLQHWKRRNILELSYLIKNIFLKLEMKNKN